MSGFSNMDPSKRRAWGVGMILFFVGICVMIAWSQWYAVHVNVPAYEKAHHNFKKL